MSNLSNEIYDWVQSQRQRPFLRSVYARLLRDERLSEADLAKLADKLIEDDKFESLDAPPSKPVTKSDSGASLRLHALEIGQHVNALRAGQELKFGETGLTVVYGDTGTGKSGYARILKRAVGTKGAEQVLSNVFEDEPPIPPEATIRFSLDGSDVETCSWQEPPPEMNQVRFFDRRVGQIYLIQESEISYRPSELVVVDSLVSICDGIQAILRQRRMQNSEPTSNLPAIPVERPAGSFLASLSASTSRAEVDSACFVPSDVDSQLATLRTRQAQMAASDPEAERKQRVQVAAYYREVGDYLDSLMKNVGESAHKAVEDARESAKEARRAAELAALQSFDTEPLSGVGTETWRALWKAARDYSLSHAYPGRHFPVVDADGRCVLCHQELGDDAQARLEHFERFVQDRTEQQAKEAEEELSRRLEQVELAVITPPAVIAAVAHVSQDDVELSDRIELTIELYQGRAKAVVTAEDAVPAVPSNARTFLQTLRERQAGLMSEASVISQEQHQKSLQEMQSAIAELEDQRAMSSGLGAILKEISRLQLEERIDKALGRVDTTALTRKSTVWAREYGTLKVQDHFRATAQRLRVDRGILRDLGGRKGRLRSRPELEGAVQPTQLPEVLSEGEQSALALAGFFTEANFDLTESSLVLDDPASSVDHTRRRIIAECLADLASDRQVVVFTHDAAFVSVLESTAKESQVDFTRRSIERRGDLPGTVMDSHPWVAKNVDTRLGELKHDLRQLKKHVSDMAGPDLEREISDWSGRLSETMERMLSAGIATPLFNPSKQEVATMMLKVVARVSEDDKRQYDKAYAQVSGWARRHDPSAELNSPTAEISELEEALAQATSWWNAIKGYRD